MSAVGEDSNASRLQMRLRWAKLLLEEGKWEAAEQKCSEALGLDPACAEARALLLQAQSRARTPAELARKEQARELRKAAELAREEQARERSEKRQRRKEHRCERRREWAQHLPIAVAFIAVLAAIIAMAYLCPDLFWPSLP